MADDFKEEIQRRMGESNGVRIRGVDNQDARETLRSKLNAGRISGIEANFALDCPPVWDDLTDLPVFDREIKNNGVDMVFAEICVPPLTWLRLQAGAGRTEDAERFLFEPLLRGETLEDMIKEIEGRTREIPKPVLELDRNGDIRPFQEGRTRGVAAFYSGVQRIPVLVMLNTSKSDGKATLSPPSEFRLRGELEQNKPEELQ